MSFRSIFSTAFHRIKQHLKFGNLQIPVVDCSCSRIKMESLIKGNTCIEIYKQIVRDTMELITYLDSNCLRHISIFTPMARRPRNF